MQDMKLQRANRVDTTYGSVSADTIQIYRRSAAFAIGVLFDKKWKVHLLCSLLHGPVRLGQLVRTLPGASKKVLIQHLRQLEVDGIIVRIDKSDAILHVEYELVCAERDDIRLLIDQLARWGRHHLRAERQ